MAECPGGHGAGVTSPAVTAFVLGGGGVLGAAEVGMVRALLVRGVVPDIVIGSSIGALNGLAVAAEPTVAAADRLADRWAALGSRQVFAESLPAQLHHLLRHGTALHSNAALRRLVEDAAGDARIEQLPVRFQCVAASIERAGAHWFTDGPVVDAVLASCAVPGLFPPVRIGDEHFLDGGLVASVPVGRAVDLGATCVFVLHVGRLELPLTAPTRPWDVATVAFEIARRHQFVDEMARLPAGVDVHVLPTGGSATQPPWRYRNAAGVRRRIDDAFAATTGFLDRAGL